MTSGESILTIGLNGVTLLEIAEFEKVGRSVVLVVVLAGRPELHPVFHARSVFHPHEVIVPWTIIRNLKNTKK